MNIWLTLITQEREKDIEEMTRDISPFDGIVAVVNTPSEDKTFDILESRKKKGKIIKRPFVQHHGFLMNEFLFSGVIKNLDWFLILDSSDRINPVWLSRLRDDIEHWDKNGVSAVYLDRVYLARYHDGIEFFGGIHWGLGPIIGGTVDISQINGYRKENWIINKRKSNPNVSGIEHPIKYYIEYSSPSQVDLLYRQFGEEVYKAHLINRLRFRTFVQKELGFECTVSNLIDYVAEKIKNQTLPKFLVEFIESEVNMKDLVRYYILKQDFLGEICANRFNWSFKKFYLEGAEHQGREDGYVGLFNQYRISQGKEME